jgi:hypothetical protein
MIDFEQWQKELDAAEAAALSTSGLETPTNMPLSAEDQAVHELCAQFSEVDLLTPAKPEATATAAAHETTDATEAEEAHEPPMDAPSLPASDCSFKRAIKGTESVEEAYMQLVGIADELCEELVLRKWDGSKDFVDAHINQLRVAYDSHQMEGLASSVARGLGKLKAGLETCAGNAYKTQGSVADVGELFLLTALAAHELRLALSEVYDC